MKILSQPIKKSNLLDSNVVFDGPMIKAVVDVKKSLIGIDAEMHADIEQFLISNGSQPDDLWGINLYPEDPAADFIEYDSMINIRPRQGNRSRSVENPRTQNQIKDLVTQWIK